MKSKTIIGTIAILTIILGFIIVSLCNKNGSWFNTPTSTPSLSLTETFERTPTTTFMVVCTPPRCAIGTRETYYCPGVCPGGCGTTCGTYTSTP